MLVPPFFSLLVPSFVYCLALCLSYLAGEFSFFLFLFFSFLFFFFLLNPCPVGSTIRPTQKNDNRCYTRRAVSVVGLFTCESRRHDSPDKDGGIASSSTRDLLNSQTFPAPSEHPKLRGTKNTISKHYCTFYHLPRSAAWVPHLCLQGSLFHVSMGLTFALYTSDLHPSYATD